jgi:hypothetical protein
MTTCTLSPHHRFVNLEGRQFGKLRVLTRYGYAGKRPRITWLCKCDCGNEKIVVGESLTQGRTTSCGCYQLQAVSTHRGTYSKEYSSWKSIKQRTLNRNCPHWSNYGGRGIHICDSWKHSFEEFLKDMGPIPNSCHSIDRIDNDGHYEPANCRWATQGEQMLNTRCTRKVVVNGQEMPLMSACRIYGLNINTVRKRLKNRHTNAMSIDECFTTPIDSSRNTRAPKCSHSA